MNRMTSTRTALALAILVFFSPSLFAGRTSECDLTVVIDGSPGREYHHQGTTYVEAIRGSGYTLRLHNPTPHRVAVALSVDGLNTIDARHTNAWSASKWIIDPYDTIEIGGWQVSDRTARRFVFTGERNSYGAALGQTENLGVIEAIFYRERARPIAKNELRRDERERAAPSSAAAEAQDAAAPSDDYAATGMGGRTRHDVTRVAIDLDPAPIESLRIRYEFRPQLVKLGVLDARRSALERRESARGFEGYCPEP